jgi:hypothetical protein
MLFRDHVHCQCRLFVGRTAFGVCSDCEDDPEGEDTDDVAAEVSTTLTDGESSDQGPQNGEFRALMFSHLTTNVKIKGIGILNRMENKITNKHG